MMRYRIIEGYAYDVINDAMEGNVIMMSYESGKAQNTRKCNIILSLELELLDREYKTHFSEFQIVKRVDVSGVVESITSWLELSEERGEWRENVSMFLIAA